MDREPQQRLLAIVGEARAAYLETACGGDDEVRLEVELLLAGQGLAAGLLEAPAWQDAAAALVSDEANSGSSRGTAEMDSAHLILPAGTRLGPYEIQSAIGAGGMGEVYQAADTRLGRTVAIKVLPPDLASDPERRRRFEHEARAASALNHPHICTLHDIGEAIPTGPRVPPLDGARGSPEPAEGPVPDPGSSSVS